MRDKSCGVAKYSLHMDRLAIDIRVPGHNLADNVVRCHRLE
ncbi:MAG: hypothetical protein ABI476_03030 [Oxalobacteraceae bacterium]